MKLFLACALFAAACSDAPTPAPTDQTTTLERLDLQEQIGVPATDPGVVAPPLVAMPPYSPTPRPACTSCPQVSPKMPIRE